jgi:hypothetical protein
MLAALLRLSEVLSMLFMLLSGHGTPDFSGGIDSWQQNADAVAAVAVLCV